MESREKAPVACRRSADEAGPDFAGGDPGPTSRMDHHWSSGSHIRSTNWANHINYNFGGAPTGGGPGPWPPLDPLNPALR